MKCIYNPYKLTFRFRHWLERRTGYRITGITLLQSPPKVDYWRFRFEGVKDYNLGNNKVKSRFMEMIPELRYILGSSLIRVCKEYKTGLLVLDLASEESLYQSPQQMLTLKDRLPSEGEQVMELF